MTRTTRTHVELVGSLETFVRQRVASVAADWADDPDGVGRMAQEFEVIPLLFDWGGFIGMGSTGRFLSVSVERSVRVTPLLCPRFQDYAIFSGLRFYPELAPLLPERPVDASNCKDCGGTGKFWLAGNIVCPCGGLGWIPDYW